MMKNQSDTSSIEKLLEVMAKLRDPATGCPWDREQSHQSIRANFLEETYEALDALDPRSRKRFARAGAA